MILGIGSDIIEIIRIERLLKRHQERFLNRIFTELEQKYAISSLKTAARLAKRFAAKEACAKALGTGIADGISWKDMEVKNNRQGQPQILLKGAALIRLRDLTPENMKPRVYISLSDTDQLAQATVLISADCICCQSRSGQVNEYE
ncbi:MAG: holo-ACP synthase [Pseudomonadota bacterium]